MNDSVVSIDSIGDCMEQDLVLESSNKPVYVEDHQYWSVMHNNTLLNGDFSSNDSSSPSHVYPGVPYNTVKSCVSIVISSGCTRIVKNESHSNVYFTKKLSLVDDIYHNFKMREAKAYIQEFGVLVKYQELRIIAAHKTYVHSTDLKDWVIRARALVKNSGLPNYVSCRLPVPSELNIPNWKKFLKNYPYPILCEHLEFGFPLNI